MSDDSMIEEFKIEADEMFFESEEGLLAIDRGEDFTDNFNAIFRAFHSLKGAAGMFGLEELQAHMHKLETLFEAQKSNDSIPKELVDYFLDGVDAAKEILNGGSPHFKYWEEGTTNEEAPTPSEEKVEEAPKPKRESKKIEKSEKGHIYVVDDEEFICELLSDLLKDYQYSVETFTNPEEMLERFLKERDFEGADIILSDISMPEMTGIELLKKVRESGSNIPFIFISGHITKQALMEASAVGASGYIEKPFDDHIVVGLTDNAIKRARALKVLNRSINYIMYQFHELDQYLEKEGKTTVRQSLRSELENLLEQRKLLKEII